MVLLYIFLGVIQNADILYVIDRGKIVECGKLGKLISKKRQILENIQYSKEFF